MASVSASHILLTQTQPVGKFGPELESNLGPTDFTPYSLPIELIPPPPHTHTHTSTPPGPFLNPQHPLTGS